MQSTEEIGGVDSVQPTNRGRMRVIRNEMSKLEQTRNRKWIEKSRNLELLEDLPVGHSESPGGQIYLVPEIELEGVFFVSLCLVNTYKAVEDSLRAPADRHLRPYETLRFYSLFDFFLVFPLATLYLRKLKKSAERTQLALALKNDAKLEGA